MTHRSLLQVIETLRYSDDVDEMVAAMETLNRIAEPDDVPVLLELVREEGDFFLREAAAAPLARLRGLAVLKDLLDAYEMGLSEGHDNDGLTSLIMDLVESRAQEAAPVLAAMVDDASAQRRAQAAWLFGCVRSATTVEPLLRVLNDPDERVRSDAVGSLTSFKGEPGAFEALETATRDPSECVRVQAASSLGYFGDARAIPILESLKGDPSSEVRRFAESALRMLKGSDDDAARL
jgi:HEAT repeat protein